MTRILTLLLVAQVTAEWVEISQQHYRKPIRAHSPFNTPDKVLDIEDTTKPWTYNNRSVAEYNWNRSPARPSNIGNVKRVHVGSTVKTTERVKPEDDDDLDLHVDFRDYELRANYHPTKATIELHEHDRQKGTLHRVSNVGNIKRVQLSNSPVKSPAVNYKGDREKYSNRHENTPHDEDDDKANEFERKKNTEPFKRRIYVNKVVNAHGTERTGTFAPGDDEDQVTTFNTERSKQDERNFYPTKPTIEFENEDYTNYETQRNRFYKITNSKSSEVTAKNNVFTTETIDTEEVTKINTKPKTANAKQNNVQKNMNDLEAESHENIVHVSGNNETHRANDHETKTTSHNAPIMQDHQTRKENESKINKEIEDKAAESPSSNKTKNNKVNMMENVIKFMRVVADTISKNTRRSFGGKMQYLRELKDSILANIEQRIDATWPDDDSPGARRRSRSAHASSRGHVQFPSSESALMTISFLTFAVFLIKLVLQVIQTYKHKTMMVAPLMVASGRKVFTHRGQH